MPKFNFLVLSPPTCPTLWLWFVCLKKIQQPFRRLCGTYGATITVSEMALAQPLVVGHNEEWALVRKHESEKMFGIQLAGGYPNRMVAAAELIRKEIGSGVDFVDVNLVGSMYIFLATPSSSISTSKCSLIDSMSAWRLFMTCHAVLIWTTL